MLVIKTVFFSEKIVHNVKIFYKFVKHHYIHLRIKNQYLIRRACIKGSRLSKSIAA